MLIDNYNIIIIIIGKNFYEQAIDSDIKQYKEIRKLTTGQGEDYSTGSLIDFEWTGITNQQVKTINWI